MSINIDSHIDAINVPNSIVDFERLFQKLPGPSLLLRPDSLFTIVALSDDFEKVSGKERSHLQGRGVFASFPDDPAQAATGMKNLRASLDEVQRTLKPHVMPIVRYSTQSKEGVFNERYWSVTNSPLFDESGHIQYILHKVDEVTALVLAQRELLPLQKGDKEWTVERNPVLERSLRTQKSNEELRSARDHLVKEKDELLDRLFKSATAISNAEEREKFAIENERFNFQNLFRQIPEMVCILTGPEHIFEFVNNAHIKALGFDATGRTVREAQPESVEVHGILDEVYRTGKTAELREIPVTVGTRIRYFNLTYSARYRMDGSINGVMILGSEITEQFDARAAIMKAKEAADYANEAKTAFVANMSHEIRTPLGIIIGFSDMLKDKNLSWEEHDSFLERVTTNAKGLIRIIDDILDLSKVESGNLQVEHINFSLTDLLRETIDFFADRAQAKNIQLRLIIEESFPSRVNSDPTRLRQVLINIIGNAIKFTTEGSVVVSARCIVEKDRGRRFEIHVVDTGIGLSHEQVGKIFQPFTQADSSTTRKFGGTGLGLVISQRLANALGGDVRIDEFKEGHGCSFVISFYDDCQSHIDSSSSSAPSVEQQLASSLPAAMEKTLHGLKILLAEDSIDNQMIVKRILTKNGAEVEIANDGEEAIEKALKGIFDLILMDVQMPRVNGYEATKALRKIGFDKPILALTAHAMNDERHKTRAAGCDEHLTKPINSQELIRSIRLFCDKYASKNR